MPDVLATFLARPAALPGYAGYVLSAHRTEPTATISLTLLADAAAAAATDRVGETGASPGWVTGGAARRRRGAGVARRAARGPLGPPAHHGLHPVPLHPFGQHLPLQPTPPVEPLEQVQCPDSQSQQTP